MSTAVKSPPSASAAACAAASSVAVSESGSPEDRRDAGEAALHARLPRALLVGLGVPQRERRQRGEGADDVGVALAEPALFARRGAEHAARLARVDDRRDDRCS